MQRKKEVQANGLEKKRRSILCPKCGHRLLDASVNTKAQLVTPTKNCNPDFVIKCRHCSSEIGVIKLNRGNLIRSKCLRRELTEALR